jgi:hypothetical protein
LHHVIAAAHISLPRQRFVAESKRDKIHNYRRNSIGFCLIIIRQGLVCPPEKKPDEDRIKEYSFVKRGMNPIQYGKTTPLFCLAFPAKGEHDDSP